MLQISIESSEFYDQETEEFIKVDPIVLHLEHSLYSIAKWESKWEKSYLNTKEKTQEEIIDYIRCMTLDENVDSSVYMGLKNHHFEQIKQYIESKMTATFFSGKDKPSRKIITAEIIYYQMTALNIPFECEHWHFNRLLTLIRVCAEYQQPPKKMSRRQINSRNSALNAARRSQLNSTG